MKQKRANYYAFALNEYSYRRVSFSMHRTLVGAQKSAYKQSGQSRFIGVRSGDRSAESDLYPHVFTFVEFIEFAAESSYFINWDDQILEYKSP